MQSLLGKAFAFLAMSMLITSCSSTKMLDSWYNPNLGGKKFHRILVSRTTKNHGSQKIYEDVVANELKKRGIDALPMYSKIAKGENVGDRTTLERIVKESGADAVLSIQTTNMEKRTSVQPGYVDYYPGYWYPSAFPYWDMYGFYGGRSTYYEPPIVSTYNVATIQTNLFDTESCKLIWAGTFESSEPGNTVSVSKDLAADIIDSLAKEGLI